MLDPELGVGAQLARLQRILDATCDRLDVPKTQRLSTSENSSLAGS